MRSLSPHDRLWAIGLIALALAGAAISAAAYWPGLMTWDAIRQYGQALDGSFDDWHPPAMGWVWRQLHAIHDGPPPMLILQLALYWGGFILFALHALKQGRRGLALALMLGGMMPLSLALMGAVLKDCLMAGALIAASGLLLWRTHRIATPLAIVLLLFAAALRFNAFLACLPLLAAFTPAHWREGPVRLALIWLACAVALLMAMPVANRLIGVERSGVELSLVIFDLGGITEYGGADVFPAMGVADPVATNHHCYTPIKWDSYSDWVDPQCPLGFTRYRALIAETGVSPYPGWVRAILFHPFAYAEHRLQHLNINLRFLVRGRIERPVQVESAPNDWGYRVGPNRLLRAVDDAAIAYAATPLGWPIVWMGLAMGALILAPRLPSRAIIVPLALSVLLYGGSYALFSVASELRYHLWTMTGGLIALLLVAGDLRTATPIPRRQMIFAAAPTVLILLLAIGWRLSSFGPLYSG